MQKLLTYLSFNGRANRARFWVTNLVVVGSVFVLALVAIPIAALLPLLAIVLLPAYGVILYASLANGARRLHDRGKSAWWLLLFFVVPAVLTMPGQMARYSADEGVQGIGALFALLSLPFSIWAFVEMGCLKGKAGPNRFGEDPLEMTPEAIPA